MAEYRALCLALQELHGKFMERKQELRQLLSKTADLKRETFLVLVKANSLTRHLTARQRQLAGLTYHLTEIKARINLASPVLFADFGAEGGENLPEIRHPEDRENLVEIRQRGLLLIALIDGLRKKLLQLDILELRCRELILSIDKALEAFRHESMAIQRKIYPWGFLSLLKRRLRGLWGRAYFTLRDMESISALGNITGHVLKIADSPII